MVKRSTVCTALLGAALVLSALALCVSPARADGNLQNVKHPNDMLRRSRNRGFVKVNEMAEQPDQLTDHDTMGYYTDEDLPFYYDLARTFAISDRYFADVIGQTFPNRSYLVAGTSFGH